MKDEVFYSRGLRFACTRCSSCCRGEPGFVFLSRDDLFRLLAALGTDFRSFFRHYALLVDTGSGLALSLREKPGNDCIFWSASGCLVYESRPIQCSTYPFWSGIADSAKAWAEESVSCPGIGQGELLPRSRIEEALYARRAAGTILFPHGFDPEVSRLPDFLAAKDEADGEAGRVGTGAGDGR